jgi:surfactin synthase thioesterase subunit
MKQFQNWLPDVLNNAPPVFALAGLSMGGIVAMEGFISSIR